jgi:hypothetical protein
MMMDEYDHRFKLYSLKKYEGPWEKFFILIPIRIRGRLYWLTWAKRRCIEDYSFGEYSAYYEYATI